ncbi:hypothetical protein BCR41DRAFT_374380 [Lobosporangium transversale]|uniref:Uncharacterized protein n=1 Tax=Lobosporangium transversale TaxID=64571 RepID=A0A1Y2GAV3_9FUNG|nr:hypothetical protein BCR41DRAFT_374380 [Lobosporangium transversale]ORZ05747.1 hypothetical protein BCR41DRAFT_374380 [Lobosporangium transversale]|eukprot:XP_021877234.1 hypothetical protein BCR41DRAFT_374380 [Lobosporangium transversale]
MSSSCDHKLISERIKCVGTNLASVFLDANVLAIGINYQIHTYTHQTTAKNHHSRFCSPSIHKALRNITINKALSRLTSTLYAVYGDDFFECSLWYLNAIVSNLPFMRELVFICQSLLLT